ncbi:anhydro-N-acetylmuramic acid kinase [Robiginitalea sediminis]|uniref:anhydro-N-acetylmuramic acid kinase n=1 Tax=Robiginitalea sediminis TaxID=1982593 RepID=UPI000B4B1889|nr:anhydro-N-acetylmuramic acid kinase [Robiginitalea sediminis]
MSSYTVLGMMSGTSLDGLDLALVRLEETNGHWSHRFLKTGCTDYTSAMRQRLEQAIRMPAPELLAFHAEYGKWLGKQAKAFLADYGETVDAIASHGHTVHHLPQKGFTFQMGCPQHLALEAGIRTIGDFRSLDMALGGQGAPLVPIGDRLLFGAYDFCLNLGGISNISFEKDGKRLAFDIGVANMLLNALSRLASAAFDAGGEMARKGVLIPEFLNRLDALSYYDLPFPKSTGYEWFSSEVWPIAKARKEAPKDLLHTAVVHIARQIARQVSTLSTRKESSLLVTGGGAYNTFLMEVLQEKLPEGVTLVIPDSEQIAYKEALVFALLGALRLRGEVNVLSSVTGGSRDSCSGVLFEP